MSKPYIQYMQHQHHRRRQQYDFNSFFYDFQVNVKRIVNDYACEMRKVTDKGCHILLSLRDRHKDSQNQNNLQQQQQRQQSHYSSQKQLSKSLKKWSIYQKKQLHTINEDSQMSFANPKLSQKFEYSEFKFDFKSPILPTQDTQQDGSQKYQLDLEEELNSCEKKENQKNSSNVMIKTVKNHHNDSPPHHSLTFQQLIESTKKSLKKSLESLEDIQEEGQYALTDYSSNQSSNEGSYRIYEIEDQVPSLKIQKQQTFSQDFRPKFNFSKFKALKQNNIQITSSLKKKFKPTNIMNSPMKSKRLVCRTKVIPRWAENLSQLSTSNQGKNPDQIFGKCIVQNLNLHFLFQNQVKQYQQRRSSALWHHDTSL